MDDRGLSDHGPGIRRGWFGEVLLDLLIELVVAELPVPAHQGA